MTTKTLVLKGKYYDSVTLMNVARQVGQLPGVVESAVVMGTAANREILRNSGLDVVDLDSAGDADLLIVVRGEDAALEPAFARAQEILRDMRKRRDPKDFRPRSIEGALQVLPDASLSLISVAGPFAADEARKALESGLDVMLFSDNVPLEREIELKRLAHERGLLVMGPDCGTAIIGGVPLAFANVVQRGDIGAVAAAGTGLQEVTTLISNGGGGISHAIGTGGRDVKREVGGITFIDALRALAADPGTRTIVLVSKPPHPEVMARIGEEVRKIDKPVVAAFLGAEAGEVARWGMRPAATLEDAAMMALATDGRAADRAADRRRMWEVAYAEATRFAPSQKYVRGLFSGGTFCYEAQLLLQGTVQRVHSNTPTASSVLLEDPHRSVGHTVVDLGDDTFTVGRPHPMIDFATRNRRIVQEAADPETAVILLDLVLGHGANLTPLEDLLPALDEARRVAGGYLPIVCSVTGTDADPQHRGRVVEGLQAAGVVVERSNAAACRLAAGLAARTGAAV